MKWTAWIASVPIVLLLANCATVSDPDQLLMQPTMEEYSYVGETLSVLSLNMAHGRKDGLNQLLVSKEKISSNLDDISDFLEHSGADLVALQEADGPSRWSGNFDHALQLTKTKTFPAAVRTSHAVSWLFSYGTALLSKKPFTETLHHTFQPSPPTMNKGFTLGQISWKKNSGSAPVLVDVISVHLDFSRKSIREQQISEMREVLAGRENLVIILGDFNSDWFADERVVRALAEGSGSHVYQPESDQLGTYKSTHRLDWILISEELTFVDYKSAA